MKKIAYIVLALMVIVSFVRFSYAAEHGGKEHAGEERGAEEHAGVSTVEPSAENIRQSMNDYVLEESAQTGTFDIYDPETENTRRLTLIRIHERVGKAGDYYYSCADFKDIDTNQIVDLDIDVEHTDGDLNVVDVRIHKVDGKERYTYDENDNRIPVTE